MDWDDDYYTFSDTNIEYIWRFLEDVHERGWLYQGHRAMAWCPRCGTSLSEHEQRSSKLPGARAPVALRALPARARGRGARRLDDDAVDAARERRGGRRPDAEYGAARRRLAARARPLRTRRARVARRGARRLDYEGPFDELPAQHGVEHRVIPWDDVTLEEGTGIVHIAPGCGAEDFELSRVHDLSVLTPIGESGRFLPGYGALEGSTTDEARAGRRAAGGSGAGSSRRARSSTATRTAGAAARRSSSASPTTGSSARGDPRNRCWTRTRPSTGRRLILEADGRLAAQPRRLEHLPQALLRPAAAVLPVRVRAPERDRLARRAAGARRRAGSSGCEELHRPWIDEVDVRCEGCGGEVRRIPEVGDAWLDAGIVPFSTLGWQSPRGRCRAGNATGAAAGLTGADLPDHAYWETWFPADWVTEMREQIRLWFYSQSFHVGRARGPRALPAGALLREVLDETGARCTARGATRSTPNEAIERMGADVMRWLYCAQPPTQNIRFGYGPAKDVKRRLLTLWNCVSLPRHLREHRGLPPASVDGAGRAASAAARRLAPRPHRRLVATRRRLRAQLASGA